MLKIIIFITLRIILRQDDWIDDDLKSNGERSQFSICTELPELKDRDLWVFDCCYSFVEVS